MKNKLLFLLFIYFIVFISGCSQDEVEFSQIEDETNFAIDLPIESKAAISDFLYSVGGKNNVTTRAEDKIYLLRGWCNIFKDCKVFSGRNCLPFDIVIYPEENSNVGLLATRGFVESLDISKIEKSWSLTDEGQAFKQMIDSGKLTLSYDYNEQINTVYFIYECKENANEKFIIPFSMK